MNQGKRKTWPLGNGGPDIEQMAKGISRLMMKDNPRTMAKPQVESHEPRLIRRTKEPRTQGGDENARLPDVLEQTRRRFTITDQSLGMHC